MRDFQEFIEKNRHAMYAVAYGNCKHDEEWHCIFPKDDTWIDDDWDNITNLLMQHMEHYGIE